MGGITTVGGGSGDVVGPSSAVDSEVAVFSGTGGKTIKRAVASGIAKLVNGVLSAIALPSDATKFLDGTGAFSTPASGGISQGQGDARYAMLDGTNGPAVESGVRPACTLVGPADSPYSVQTTDFVIIADATAGAVVITLPAADDGNQLVRIKKLDSTANTVTINAAGGQTIDGASSLVLTTQNEAKDFQAVNQLAAWVIL